MARTMKSSGVDWIGDIPQNWQVIRTKNRFTTHKDIAGNRADDFERLALTLGGVIKRPKDDAVGLQPEAFNGYQILRENELVFKLIDLANIATSRVGYSPYTGLVSPAYIVLTPKEKTESKYGEYFFLSLWQREIFNHMGDNGVRSSLNATDLLNVPYLAVSPGEQQRIVDFLDHKCAEIDSVILATEKTIEEYKALKQSIITEAVTHGIRGERPMKDSGIEWIGEIPIDWDLLRITRILDYSHPYPIGDGDHGLIKTEDYVDSGIPFIRVQNIGWATPLNMNNIVYITPEKNQSIKNSILRPRDVLFAKTGATIGKTAIVPEDLPISNTTSHVGKITIDSKYNSRFVFYVLSSFIGYKQLWDIAIQKTTRPELSIDEIKAIRILMPFTRIEQDEIVSYIDVKTKELDRLIETKQQLLIELDAYKKSVIYEYVTGKKEV